MLLLAAFHICTGKGSFEVVVWFTCVFVHNGIVISKKSSEFSRSVRHGFEHIGQKSSLFKEKEKQVKNCNLTRSTEGNINAVGFKNNLLAQKCWAISADPFSCPFTPFMRMTEHVMMWFLIRCCCSLIARLIALLTSATAVMTTGTLASSLPARLSPLGLPAQMLLRPSVTLLFPPSLQDTRKGWRNPNSMPSEVLAHHGCMCWHYSAACTSLPLLLPINASAQPTSVMV